MKKKLQLKGMLRAYLNWPIILSILFLAMDIQLFFVNRKAGVLGGIYWVIYVLVTGLICFTGRRKIRKDLIQFAANYGQMQMSMIKEMDVP